MHERRRFRYQPRYRGVYPGYYIPSYPIYFYDVAFPYDYATLDHAYETNIKKD